MCDVRKAPLFINFPRCGGHLSKRLCSKSQYNTVAQALEIKEILNSTETKDYKRPSLLVSIEVLSITIGRFTWSSFCRDGVVCR